MAGVEQVFGRVAGAERVFERAPVRRAVAQTRRHVVARLVASEGQLFLRPAGEQFLLHGCERGPECLQVGGADHLPEPIGMAGSQDARPRGKIRPVCTLDGGVRLAQDSRCAQT